MEKRVNLFMQGVVLLTALLLSLLIAWSMTAMQQDKNRALLEDIRTLQTVPDASYRRLHRGPVEDPAQFDSITLMENGGEVMYSLPKEGFMHTYLSILPITIVVMGIFVLVTPAIARRFTLQALDPVTDDRELSVADLRDPFGQRIPARKKSVPGAGAVYQRYRIRKSPDQLFHEQAD